MTEYQYADCGLDWVWLENGFERHVTDQGQGTPIDRGDEPHRAIASVLVLRRGMLRGQEVRFLRAIAQLSPCELGAVLATVRAPTEVGTLEAERDAPVAAEVDRSLRAFTLGLLKGDGPVEQVTGAVDDLEALGTPTIFYLGPFGWGIRPYG